MRRFTVLALVAGCAQSHVAATGAAPPPPPAAPASAEAAPEVVAPIEEPPPPPPVVPAPKLRRPGAYANLDPDDDFVVGPPDTIDDCDDQLAKAGVKFAHATLAVHEQKKSHIVCGAPQVVTYLRGPGNIAYSAPPLLTCGMALALAQFEKIVQEESLAILKAKVARIDQLGTYNCREMANYKGWVSEHSYANAIDVGRFVLADGRAIEVLRDFDVGDGDPKKAAGAFLRVVSRRANDEDVFSHVLTPFFDALHKNHFHLDLARYRSDGTRPQQI